MNAHIYDPTLFRSPSSAFHKAQVFRNSVLNINQNNPYDKPRSISASVADHHPRHYTSPNYLQVPRSNRGVRGYDPYQKPYLQDVGEESEVASFVDNKSKEGLENKAEEEDSLIQINRTYSERVVQSKTMDLTDPSQIKWLTFARYFNAIFIGTFLQTFQWVGWWDILTEFLWPWDELIYVRDFIYVIIGLALITVSTMFFGFDTISDEMELAWKNGVPTTFCWVRKIRNYCKKLLSFFGFLLAWAGAWDLFDTFTIPDSEWRDLVFLLIPLFVGLFTEEFLSTESLYYIYYKVRLHNKKKEWERVWEKNRDVENQTLTTNPVN